MTTTPKPTRTPKLSGLTIAALLETGPRTTLVVHADGKLDTPDLAEEQLPASSRIVLGLEGKPCTRLWADAYLTQVTAAATKEGTSTKLGTMRAEAARLANDELLEAYQVQLAAWQADQDAAAAAAVVPTPPAPAVLVPQQRRGGRHVAPLSPANREREEEARWSLVMDVLEVIDPAA